MAVLGTAKDGRIGAVAMDYVYLPMALGRRSGGKYYFVEHDTDATLIHLYYFNGSSASLLGSSGTGSHGCLFLEAVGTSIKALSAATIEGARTQRVGVVHTLHDVSGTWESLNLDGYQDFTFVSLDSASSAFPPAPLSFRRPTLGRR